VRVQRDESGKAPGGSAVPAPPGAARTDAGNQTVEGNRTVAARPTVEFPETFEREGWLSWTVRSARRAAIALVGSTVLLIGLAMAVLPGPAVVVIPIGLGILGLEFAWARRWLSRLKEHAASALRAAGRPVAAQSDPANAPRRASEIDGVDGIDASSGR
jgi:tellurite resistance protein TerC